MMSTTQNGKKMHRPSIEKVFREIGACVKRHGLRVNWHSTGRLIDCLAADGHDDVVAVICEAMNKNDRWTRSAFIAPMITMLQEHLAKQYVNGTGI